jgi:hypothetical protein
MGATNDPLTTILKYDIAHTIENHKKKPEKEWIESYLLLYSL